MFSCLIFPLKCFFSILSTGFYVWRKHIHPEIMCVMPKMCHSPGCSEHVNFFPDTIKEAAKRPVLVFFRTEGEIFHTIVELKNVNFRQKHQNIRIKFQRLTKMYFMCCLPLLKKPYQFQVFLISYALIWSGNHNKIYEYEIIKWT